MNSVFSACLPKVGSVFSACLPKVGSVFSACLPKAGSVFSACLPKVGSVFSACLPKVGSVFSACLPKAGSVLGIHFIIHYSLFLYFLFPFTMISSISHISGVTCSSKLNCPAPFNHSPPSIVTTSPFK